MKSPIFGKEKLLYFPQKSGIVPIFKKSPSSYISYFCHHAPCFRIILYFLIYILSRCIIVKHLLREPSAGLSNFVIVILREF